MKLAQVTNVTFDDYDLDASDIGGNLTWSPADNEAGKVSVKQHPFRTLC